MRAACQREAFQEFQLLGIEQLEALCASTAGGDGEDAFSAADFDILRDSGYLIQAVPEELGGLGFPVSHVGCQQRRLARYAPAVALAVHSHLYWTGLAADLWHDDDPSLEWLLREAADGEVIAASHVATDGAGGPTAPYRDSEAQRVDGGYCFTGHTRLDNPTPAWTRLAVRGVDRADGTGPQIVHAFIARDSDGLDARSRSDGSGTGAKRFGDTRFDAVFVPDRYVARRVPQGSAAADPFVLSHLVWVVAGIGNVSYGTAQAAFERAVAAVAATATRPPSESMARQATPHQAIAEMAMSLQTIEALLDGMPDDWHLGIDHADRWPAQILGTGYRSAELARAVVDAASELADRGNDSIPQCWRWLLHNATPGINHPADVVSAREIIARSHLGRQLDEAPRQGSQST